MYWSDKMELLGYQVEKLQPEQKDGAGQSIAYILHGKKVDYKLIRYANDPSNRMYAVNSKGNICGIKGNYTFTDADGSLTCWYPYSMQMTLKKAVEFQNNRSA
jgi:hypothetical protein